jgi:hypothetical protein
MGVNMHHKKVTVFILIVLAGIVLVLAGYFFRVDRFGLSQISWIDCVQVNDIKYNSDFERTPIEYSSVGEKIGEVTFNVYENVHNSMYRFRNGDATFLDVGTELFLIKSDSNAIAVKVNDQYFIYKADIS